MVDCFSRELKVFCGYVFPVLVWVAVIFVVSAFPGSGTGEYSFAMFLERKAAHIAEYVVLSLLLLRMYLVYAPGRVVESAMFVATVALLYAVSDEIHQLFVFGREGKLSDVLIDSLGIIIGTTLYIFYRLSRYSEKK